ncbi:winged helix-turn-helix domain-containing protein [Gilvimarinus sp. SDUM040013]|uniref:Winged helix-turn-helix domain-containing protein n=1 Tax=Gilvimarinus gilvus TaxID=3058038 RepID=A0ABU4S2R9_9GAMM|nr:winged helix-turn-helix domain-containing protein [Gilvimarinus sp. SDUM040013]MDO3385834.1 winged helix-turn-helix domain-containing protein [Gilvimarinus sp. SDUM040013]MDX6851377.1 winged helix-turn-helix domain-containing protein [Gilvimarinus sp. SDUM040013]
MTKTTHQCVRLNHILVDFHNRRLRDGQSDIDIDGQSLRVLQVLIEHYPDTVPRQQLLDEAWHDLVVSDNSLSQCVANLRRVWQDDPKTPTFIRTVPRQGYQLLAQPRSDSKRNRRGSRYALVAGLSLVVALGIYYLADLQPSNPRKAGTFTSLPVEQFQPARVITSRPGLELFQRFSPDGKWLAYAQAGADGDFDLVKTEIVSGSHTVLLTGESDAYPGDWSVDGSALIAVVQTEDTCELRVLSAHKENLNYPLYRCEYHDLPARVRWVTKNQMLIAHSVGGEPRLTHLTLSTCADGRLEVSEENTIEGVHPEDLDVTTDGRYLLLSERLDSEARYRLSRYDMQSGELQELDSQASPYWGISWLDNHLEYLIGGHLRRGRLDAPWQSAYPATNSVWDVDYHTIGKLAISEARAQINLTALRVEPSNAVPTDAIAPSSKVDFLPAFSADGAQLAFVSNRQSLTGLGIWRIDYPHGEPELLTELADGILPQRIAWSLDNKYLAVLDNRHKLYCLNIKNRQWRQISKSPEKSYHPFWTEAGLAFSQQSDDVIDWVVWSSCKETELMRRRVENIVLQQPDNGNLLLGDPKTGLVYWQNGATVAQAESLNFSYIDKDVIYYFQRDGQELVLKLQNLKSGSTQNLHRSLAIHYGNIPLQIAVHESTGDVIIPTPQGHQADIVLLSKHTQNQ